MIEEIPEEVETSKLYISGDVEFIDSLETMSQIQQDELESIVRSILHRVGLILRVDDDAFSSWIATSPIMELIDDSPDSIFAVSAMLLGFRTKATDC